MAAGAAAMAVALVAPITATTTILPPRALRLEAALDNLVELAAIKPNAPAIGTIVNLDLLALGHYQGDCAYRTFHTGH